MKISFVAVSVSVLSLVTVVILVAVSALLRPQNANLDQIKSDNLKIHHSAPFRKLAGTFKDVSLIHNLTNTHIQHSGKVRAIADVHGVGACVDDFDNDGWVDLLFTNGGGQTRLFGNKAWWQKHRSFSIYRNEQGMFQRVDTDNIDIPLSTTACATADFDADGDIDLIIATKDKNTLLRNLGDFRFEPVQEFTSLVPPGWTSSVLVVDINADGLPDLHFSEFSKFKYNQKGLNNAAGFSVESTMQSDTRSFDGLSNHVLINLGDMKFENRTESYGLNHFSERTVGAFFYDSNHDGLSELLETNSGDHALRTHRNTGDTFVQDTELLQGLLVNDTKTVIFGQGLYDKNAFRFISRPSGVTNILHQLDDIKNPSDIGWSSQLLNHKTMYLNSWGAIFSDFNNDGFIDLTTASGASHKDGFASQMSSPMKNLCAFQTDPQSTNQTKFISTQCAQNTAQSSRGVYTLDFDNDGRLDLLFTNNNDFPTLLQNTSEETGNFIVLTIPPEQRFTFSTITLTNKQDSIRSSVNQHQALFGQRDPRLHFGLGDASSVDVAIYNKEGEYIYGQTLEANNHYLWEENKWRMEKFNKTSPFEKSDIPFTTLLAEIRRVENTHLSQGLDEAFFSHIKLASQIDISRIVRLLERPPSSFLLGLYHQLLTSENLQIMKSSSRAIAELESEASVNDLLNYLDDVNAESRFCAVSEIFQTWFEEEEAVTRGKWKAIPKLMKRLGDVNGKIVDCAAEALSFAEHENTANVILKIYHDAPKEARASLIKAIGLARQREIIPFLHEILSDSEDLNVINEVIIALIRLNDKDLNNLIQKQSRVPEREYVISLALNILKISSELNSNSVATQRLGDWKQPSSKYPELETLKTEQHVVAFLKLANEDLVSPPTIDEVLAYRSETILSTYLDFGLWRTSLDNKSISTLLNRKLTKKQHEWLKITLKKQPNLLNHIKIVSPNSWLNLYHALPLLKNKLIRLVLNSKRTVGREQNMRPADFLFSCATMPSKLSTYKDAAGVVPAIKQEISLCDFVMQIGNTNISELSSSLEYLFFLNPSKNAHFAKRLMIVTQGLSEKELNKITTALLFQSELPRHIKLAWATGGLSVNRLKRTWLQNNVVLTAEELTDFLDNVLSPNIMRQIFEKPLNAKNNFGSEDLRKVIESYR